MAIKKLSVAQLMRASFDDIDEFNRCRITKHQIETIKLVINAGEMTSVMLAKRRKISIQSANASLTGLLVNNWLQRTQEMEKSGGLYYIYRCNQSAWGK